MKKAYDVFSLIIFAAVTVLLLIFPEDAKESAYMSLSLCARSVIPSLFPFCVLCSLFISSEMFQSFSSALPMGRIFGLGKAASAPIIFGCLFGFPIGAKTAAELYKSGRIGKSEAESLMAVSNNSGPAFIVSVIGGAFWHDATFGLYLYISQLLSGLLSGLFVTRILFPLKSSDSIQNEQARIPLSVRFTDAVKSAVTSIMNICGFVCTFSVIGGLLKKVFINEKLYLLLISFLEITTASETASRMGGVFGSALCAFAVGFSGFSVVFQVASFAVPLGLSLKKTVISKLIQGPLCALFILPLWGKTGAQAAVLTVISPVYSYITAAILTCFCVKKAITQHKI